MNQPFSIGDRVVAYGRPHLGVGIVTDVSDGLVVEWLVRFGDETRRARFVSWPCKSHLRPASYAPRNKLRDMGPMLLARKPSKRALGPMAVMR